MKRKYLKQSTALLLVLGLLPVLLPQMRKTLAITRESVSFHQGQACQRSN